ncbi:MAG: hypothetical protein WCV81_01580 [Microgenomates group bacterium]|jgi:hypothetical protein
MSKKNIFVVIGFLILGLISTYIATLIEILMSSKVLSGASGFPFKYGYSSFFGGSTINQSMFIVDVIFWAVVLFGIWKLFLKLSRR